MKAVPTISMRFFLVKILSKRDCIAAVPDSLLGKRASLSSKVTAPAMLCRSCFQNRLHKSRSLALVGMRNVTRTELHGIVVVSGRFAAAARNAYCHGDNCERKQLHNQLLLCPKKSVM